MRIVNGLGFPDRGDFYKLLPYVMRGQDGGLLYAFCELLRKNHSILKEFSRLDWLATDPMSLGRYISENFSVSEDEVSEFLADVQAGKASLDRPPPALVDVLHTLSEFRQLLTLLATDVGSGIPLQEFTDSVARSIVKSARLRHQTRSSKWFVNNLGMLLGLGETNVTEYWTDNTESSPLTTPTEYPHISDGAQQVPQGDINWDGWDPLSESLGRVTLTFESLSTNPLDPSFADRIINDQNPWVNWSSAGVPSPGVYQFPIGSARFPKIIIPDLLGSGSSVISSRWAGSSRYVEITVTNHTTDDLFDVQIIGPVSEVKFKSNLYKVVLYVNLMMAASQLEASQAGVSYAALFNPLSLLFREEFAPVTRMLDGLVAGVGFIDQIEYAPHRLISNLVLEDDLGTKWKVVLSPSVDAEPYLLTQPTLDEIAEAAALGPVRQWDDQLRAYFNLTLVGSGETAILTPVATADTPFTVESHTVFTNPWFLNLNNGKWIVSSQPPSADHHISGDTVDVTSLFNTVQDDNSVVGHLMVTDQEPVEQLVLFHDRPQDAVVIAEGVAAMVDQAGFPVAEGMVADLNRWVTGEAEAGTDIRFRHAEAVGQYFSDNSELWVANRNLQTEGFFRHGKHISDGFIRLLKGDGTYVDSALPAGPMESSVMGDMSPFSNLNLSSYPPCSGVFRVNLEYGGTLTAVTAVSGGRQVSLPNLVVLPAIMLVTDETDTEVVRVRNDSILPLVTFDSDTAFLGDCTVLQFSGYAVNLSLETVSFRLRSDFVEEIRVIIVEQLDGTTNVLFDQTLTIARDRTIEVQPTIVGAVVRLFTGFTNQGSSAFSTTPLEVSSLGDHNYWACSRDKLDGVLSNTITAVVSEMDLLAQTLTLVGSFPNTKSVTIGATLIAVNNVVTWTEDVLVDGVRRVHGFTTLTLDDPFLDFGSVELVDFEPVAVAGEPVADTDVIAITGQILYSESLIAPGSLLIVQDYYPQLWQVVDSDITVVSSVEPPVDTTVKWFDPTDLTISTWDNFNNVWVTDCVVPTAVPLPAFLAPGGEPFTYVGDYFLAPT